MRRLVILAASLLVTTAASAQVTTTHLLLPSYGGSQPERCAITANQMCCWRFRARLGITNATKMAAAMITGGGTGDSCGAAIYPDSASGAALGRMTQSRGG